MKILTIALVFISISVYSQNKVRVQKMRDLKIMLGSWDVNTKMMPPGQPVIPETGTMTCKSLYDSTYIECDVALTNGRSKRAYKAFVTYDPDSSRYVQHYLYSNMPILITETGIIKGNEFTTVAKFTNQGGKQETVTAILKIGKDQLEYESRSTSTNDEIDYVASYKKRTN